MPATRTRPSTRFKNLSEDLEGVNSNPNPNSNLHQQSPGTQGVVGAKSKGKKLNFKCTYLKCCRSFISNKELQAHKEEVHYMKPIVCPYPLCPVTCKKPSKNFDHHIASHGPPETWKLDQIVKEVQAKVEEDGRGNLTDPRMQVQHEEFQDDLPSLSLSPFQNHLLSRESFSSSGSSPSSSSAASSSAASGMTSSSSQSTEFDFMSPSSSAPRPSILNRPFMNSYASLQQSFMNQDPSLDQENYYNQSHLGLKPAAKINENFSYQNPNHDFNYQPLDFDFSSSKGLIYHHRQDSMSTNQGSGHLNWHQHQQQYQYQTPPQTNVNSHYPSRVNYSYENNGTLGLKGADEEAEQSFRFRS